MSQKIYEFQKDLSTSQQEASDADWYSIYEKMFVDFNNMGFVKDKETQAQQIDRVILLNNGAEINVEEKVDYYNNQRVALELVADVEHHKLGWMEKPSNSQWLAYKKQALGQCLFLPMRALKEAYKANAGKWQALAANEQEDYKFGRAQNKGYSSISLLVPIKELLGTVRGAKLITYKVV